MINQVLEKLDLSDNELHDSESHSIVRFIKKKAEERDNAIW